MGYKVIDGRLYRDGRQVPFVATPNVGGRMSPDMIVAHDTAGRLTPGNSVTWLCNPKAKASAHLVLERDGSVTQLADFDRQTWHAGVSTWQGVSGVNRRAIGIEMVGPGKLVRFGERCTAWYGETYDIAEYGLQEARSSYHGSGWWMPPSAAQMAAMREICAALAQAYKILPENIVGHYHISPGRKVDPSPLFDFADLRKAVETQPAAPREFMLAKGSRGPEVATLQVRLKELGYDLGAAGADGIFGTRTRNAVLAWEAEQGRATDGVIDRLDFTALTSEDAKEMPETPVAAEAAEQKAKAASAVDKTAIVTISTLSLSALGSDDLWGAAMGGLSRLTEAVGKLAGLGIKVPPGVIMPMIAAALIGALWHWSRKARGA